MKRLLLTALILSAAPVSAQTISSTITDSVLLTVQGAAVQSEKVGASYSVSGSNMSATSMGGISGAGTYAITNAGQAFTFSEAHTAADTAVTSQTVNAGTIASPNLYGNSTTQLGGDKGTLAGSLSATGVPTVTAGGPGTSATAQRQIELTVFP